MSIFAVSACTLCLPYHPGKDQMTVLLLHAVSACHDAGLTSWKRLWMILPCSMWTFLLSTPCNTTRSAQFHTISKQKTKTQLSVSMSQRAFCREMELQKVASSSLVLNPYLASLYCTNKLKCLVSIIVVNIYADDKINFPPAWNISSNMCIHHEQVSNLVFSPSQPVRLYQGDHSSWSKTWEQMTIIHDQNETVKTQHELQWWMKWCKGNVLFYFTLNFSFSTDLKQSKQKAVKHKVRQFKCQDTPVWISLLNSGLRNND